MTVKPLLESNPFPRLQIPINALNIWLMTASVQENMRSLTAAHALPFNLALFSMPLCHTFTDLGLYNCRRPAEPLRDGTRLRLEVVVHASPTCVQSDFWERGRKLLIYLFIYVLWQGVKRRRLPLKALGCERVWAGEGVIKMWETFAPNLLWKAAASL